MNICRLNFEKVESENLNLKTLSEQPSNCDTWFYPLLDEYLMFNNCYMTHNEHSYVSKLIGFLSN